MIGPPGLPKYGRHVFALARRKPLARHRWRAWRWVVGLYFAGVLAHFSHNLAFDLSHAASAGSVVDALATAPVSFAWPADLIGTLIGMT